MLLEAPRFLTMSVVPRKLSLWKLRSTLITCVSTGLKGLMSLNPLWLSLRKEAKPTSLSSNMAKNSQLGLYFILFLSRPRLVIPRLSATVSETGHWEWWSARCWSFDQGRAPASILPPPHLHDQYAIRAKYAAWAKYASIWPYTLETYHHTCMTGMRSAGLVSFCTNFITCLSFFAFFVSSPTTWKRG